MQVTIHTAKTQLSKLIEAAMAGEDVVIAKGSVPMVKIVPLHKGQFHCGILKDKLKAPIPDFLTSMPDDELDRWEGRS